jgi:hypothetical protein
MQITGNTTLDFSDSQVHCEHLKRRFCAFFKGCDKSAWGAGVCQVMFFADLLGFRQFFPFSARGAPAGEV